MIRVEAVAEQRYPVHRDARHRWQPGGGTRRTNAGLSSSEQDGDRAVPAGVFRQPLQRELELPHCASGCAGGAAPSCSSRTRRGTARPQDICLTHTTDSGLRTLSGGQYSIQVDGYLAVDQSAAPALVMEASHSVRDVYAVLGTAADAAVGLQLNVNGAPYCQLTIRRVGDGFEHRGRQYTGPAAIGSAGDAVRAVGGTDRSRLGPHRHHPTLMPDQLSKLRPDRDLQCYFQEPSAVAALSGTSPNGFTVSGCWRQQFDWVVVEWNRDNVFEHPALRNLPDGDLSGLHLSYEETRTNCIPLDSTTYDSISWSYLRIWEESNNTENFHRVPLLQYAVAADGSYTQPTVVFEFQGTPVAGDIVGLAWLDQYPNYWVVAGNSAADVASGLAANINAQTSASNVSASANGSQITLTYNGAPGANGNRVGVYGWVYSPNNGTGAWSPSWAMFQGGTSPGRWRVNLDFSNLKDEFGNTVTTTNVRKMRWTWAADLQSGNFARSEFAVAVTNWQVTGTNLAYSVAGPGSRRIEDIAPEVSYTGTWVEERGNYSGGSIHHTTTQGDHLRCTYSAAAHTLYLGTRYCDNGGQVTVQVDSNPALIVNLKRSLEDVLIRVPLGQFSGQAQHTVTVTHTGAAGTDVYFDFLEIADPHGGPAGIRRLPDHRAGNRLGHAALAGHRAGKDGLAHRHAGLQRPGQSLCRRHVVLRIDLPRQPVRLGHHRVYGRAALRRYHDSHAGRHSARTCQPDRRYGPEHCKSLRVTDHGRLVGGLGARRRNDAHDHRAHHGVGRQRPDRHHQHRQHKLHGAGHSGGAGGGRRRDLAHRFDWPFRG